MRSLRFRLFLGTSAGLLIVLLASAVALYLFVHVILYAQFDRGLEAKARFLASLVEQDEEGIDFEFAAGSLSEFDAAQQPEYFEIWTERGTVLARSASLGSRNLPRPSQAAKQPTFRPLVLPDGRRGRSVTMRFAPPPDVQRGHQDGHQDEERVWDESSASSASRPRTLTIVVAKQTADVAATLGVLDVGLAVVGAAAMLVTLVAQAWSVRRGLRPVADLAAQIAVIGEHDLAARVAPAAAPAELLPVVTRLNDLLARLDEAFTRERTFSANVAHELRTPLAGLRTALEVALAQRRDVAAGENTMRECLAICQQTERMVTNLLALARLERGQVTVRREPVDLRGLLEECWQLFAACAVERHVVVEWNVPNNLEVESDLEQLAIVLRNVFDNAVAYVDSGGHIRVECPRPNGPVELCVSNSGSRVTSEDAAQVFDRFWRGDAARSATGAHCGLGLSLCKRIVELLGGSMMVSSSAGASFKVSILLR